MRKEKKGTQAKPLSNAATMRLEKWGILSEKIYEAKEAFENLKEDETFHENDRAFFEECYNVLDEMEFETTFAELNIMKRRG